MKKIKSNILNIIFRPCLIIFVLIFLLIFDSCKKDLADRERINDEQLAKILSYQTAPKSEIFTFDQFKDKIDIQSLGSLKTAFTNPSTKQGKLMSVQTEDTYQGFAIETDSIRVLKSDGHTSYIFPVKLSSPRAITFQNLTIEVSESGTLIFINTYTPSQKWIAGWRSGHAGRFDGDISVTYLNSLTPNISVNAANVQKNGGQAKMSSTNDNRVSVRDGEQECTTTTYYFQSAYNCASGRHGPGDSGCYLTGDERAGYVNESFKITTCTGGGGGGGGGTTPTPPAPYDPCNGGGGPSVSYNGAKGSKLMVHENPDCNPQPPIPQEPQPPAKDIKNKTTDPCISKTVNAALTANKDILGMLAGIIQKFDASKTVTLNIYDGSTETGAPGQYKNGGFVNNIFQANITLQTSYFQNSSKESIITTVIHEFVHAYIHTSGDPILENDHEAISNKYIAPMASYLNQYFDIPLKDAYALAWSGVPDSKAWHDAPSDFEFTMSDGNKISKQETMNLSGPYKDNGNQPQYKKGVPLCN